MKCVHLNEEAGLNYNLFSNCYFVIHHPELPVFYY